MSAVEALESRLSTLEPEARLAELLTRFGDGLRIASSFGLEDAVVVHLAARAGKRVGVVPRVFMLDTGRLHAETYDLVERFRDTYAIPIALYAPAAEDVETYTLTRGPNAFYRSRADREACCAIRKVAPLGRALAGASAWVTGLRREQSDGRSGVRLVEDDAARPGVVKVSPLYDWTWDGLVAFAEQEGVPVHPLVAKGYPSIGCAPCTRAIAPGEHPRAGRWYWEAPDKKECGIHKSPGDLSRGAEKKRRSA